MDRIANGLGAYQLRHHEITPPPEHILRVSCSGPPAIIPKHAAMVRY
jgi:hypothetical protein